MFLGQAGGNGRNHLTEVPEMFGAETILMNRCANEELFHQTVALINDFKNYFKSHGQTIYENPSPGNKKGGISTLEDKSLGCTQKSGSALVQGVVPYGGRVETTGLNLLSAPGNDRHGSGRGRGADRPVYHRPGHAFRVSGAHSKDFHQFRFGGEEI